jgi:predicted nucleotidyltransferase
MVVDAAPPAGFTATVAQALPRAVQRIVAALDPERVVLFGSYAYGAPTPDSDVDLLVVMDTAAPRVERYLAVSRLLDPRPFPVDIIVKTPAEIAAARASGDILIDEILARGLVLYERRA